MPPIRLPAVLLSAALGCAVAALACGGGGSSPTQPSTSPTPPSGSTNVAGSWAGTATDSSGPGLMRWDLTQAGAAVSGAVTLTDTATAVSGRGTISGSLTGTTLQFTIAVPVGGFGGAYLACSANVSGQGSVSGASSITGSYSGSNSCSGAIASGQITLSKQ